MVKQNKPQRNVVGISESDESDDGQASPARQSRDEDEMHSTEHPAKRVRRHSGHEGSKRASVDVQTDQGEQAEAEAADIPETTAAAVAAASADEMDVDEPLQQTTANDVKQQQDSTGHADLAAQDSGCVLGSVFPGGGLVAAALHVQATGEDATNVSASAGAAEAAPAGGLKQRHSGRQHKPPERLASDAGRSLNRQASAKPPERFNKTGEEDKVQAVARTVWQGADKSWGQAALKLPADAKNPATPPEGDAAVGWGIWMKFNDDDDEAVWYRGKVYWYNPKKRTYWLCMEDGEFIANQGVTATVKDCQKGDFVFCRPPAGQPEAAAAAEQEQEQQPVPAQAVKQKKAEQKKKHELDRQQQQAGQAEEGKAAKPGTTAAAGAEVLPADEAEPVNAQSDTKAAEPLIPGGPHKQHQQQQPASGPNNKAPGPKQQVARKSGAPGTKVGARQPASAAAAAGGPSDGAATAAASAAAAAPGGAMRPASASRPQQQQQLNLTGLEDHAYKLASCLQKLRDGATKVQQILKQQVDALEQLAEAGIDIKTTDLRDITKQIKAHLDATQQKQGSLCAVPGHLAATGLPKAGTQLLERVQTLSASLWAAMSGRRGAAAGMMQLQQQQRRPSSGVGDAHGKQQQQQQQSKQLPGTPSKQQPHQQQRKLPGTPGKLGLGIKQEGDTVATAGEASLLDAHAGSAFAALGGLGKRGRDGNVKAEPVDAAGVSPRYADAERQQGDTSAAALAAALGPDEKLVQRFLDLVPLQPLDDPLREKAVALLSAVLQPPVAVSPFLVAHEVEQKLHAQHGIIGTGKHLYLRHLYMIWCVLGGKELMAAAEAAEKAKSAAAMAAAVQAQQAAGDREPQCAADAAAAAAQAAKQAEAADAAARAALEGLPGVADAAAVRAALLNGLATVDEVFGITSKMLGFDHQRDR